MNTLRAGTLRDRIHIQRRMGGLDEWGSPLPDSWMNITDQWLAANVQYRSGMSTIKTNVDVSEVRASICIRRRTDVDAGMRVLFNGQTFEIEVVLPSLNRASLYLVSKRIKETAP